MPKGKTKAERRRMLMQYRDLIEGKKFNPEASENTVSNTRLYMLLSQVDCLDYDYADHIRDGKPGSIRARDMFDDVIDDIGTFTFRECCAYLTLIVRADRLEGGWFEKYLNNGSIYKLVNRLIEVM